ncbi:MAG: redox-sensing transcriptional repressor Rex [Isosphaeraceae bacterium]
MPETPREPSAVRLAPKAVVGRVSLYLRQLEVFLRQGVATVSSHQLGTPLGITDAQVRKDLAFFGQFGCPGIGYNVAPLIQSLRAVLGIDREWPSALIGLGHLGQALVRYRGFALRGFQIVALFDSDTSKVGLDFDGLTVLPMDALSATVAERGIALALLAVPAEAAQEVAGRAVASGVTGLLNFAPATLSVPPHISVVSVDLSVQLEHLAYKVQFARRGGVAAVG